jgi:hypothetical protein
MKIDFDILNNSEKYYAMCGKLFEQQQGPDFTPAGNYKWPMYKDHYYKGLRFDNIEPVKENRERYQGEQGKVKLIEDDKDPSFLYKNNDTPKDAVLDRVVIDQEHALHKQIRQDLDLSHARVLLNIQQPGKFVPPHLDRNAAFINDVLKDREIESWLDVKRWIYMWEDQRPGEFFRIGDTDFRWKAGDLIQFPFYQLHGTANAGHVQRPSLSIIGVTN